MLIKLYLFALNAGLVGFAYYLDTKVGRLIKKVDALEAQVSLRESERKDAEPVVNSVKKTSTRPRKTTP